MWACVSADDKTSLSTPTATLTYLQISEALLAIFNDAVATEEPRLTVR
jgi:hypothetical protein